jgi:hypothetical protein
MVWERGVRILRVSKVLFASAVSLALTHSAYADNVLNFYTKDAALTIFGDDVETTSTPELGYAPAEKTKAIEIKEIQKEKKSSSPVVEPVSVKAAKTLDDVRNELKTPDDILKKFGDPEADIAIPGRDDAPLPFKGMMAALDVDNRELAQKYARQYVRYLKRVQNKTDKVMTVVNEAMGNEGMLPANPLNIQQELEASQEAQNEEKQDEEKLREEVRAAVKQKVPQDPFGEVDVYFFFKMDDEGSKLMIPEIQSVYEKIDGDPKVRFMGLSVDGFSAEDIKEFSDTYKINFPIKSGRALASKLGIAEFPSVVFIPHNAPTRMIVEQGFRRDFFIEEVVNLVKGVK